MNSASPQPRPLLILDLDETLIHATERPGDRRADFRIGQYHVYKRPFLNSFLATISESFDTAIWSSASEPYVQLISKQLAEHVNRWEFVWSQARCVMRFDPELLVHIPTKDLKKVKKLGYCLERTIIVDDTPQKVCRNYGNAVYVSPFEGAPSDNELLDLAEYLLSLAEHPNFRSIEKRGWRWRNQR